MLRLRDLLGRKFGRLFVSAKGFNGRCHYDRFGYALFSAQVKGSNTWLLYPAESLSLKRAKPFDNAPPQDFTKPEVYEGARGFKAHLNEGRQILTMSSLLVARQLVGK